MLLFKLANNRSNCYTQIHLKLNTIKDFKAYRKMDYNNLVDNFVVEDKVKNKNVVENSIVKSLSNHNLTEFRASLDGLDIDNGYINFESNDK